MFTVQLVDLQKELPHFSSVLNLLSELGLKTKIKYSPHRRHYTAYIF